MRSTLLLLLVHGEAVMFPRREIPAGVIFHFAGTFRFRQVWRSHRALLRGRIVVNKKNENQKKKK